ncbi:hypothetical protein G6F37_009466 [Rhizopus arrhizus]|nr:hypothetical protein G6F38_009567 [Rhizopus arrhizus]KAG1154421.1 hypothetical protein G6F37_009466 [Rhizopus arrhizus]
MALETFRIAPNPCPHRRPAHPQVIRHILLRCTNQNCRLPVVNNNGDADNRENFHLWNRDLAACLKMLHIVRSLRENDQIPKRCRHDVPQRPRRPREHADDLQDQHPALFRRNQ